MDKLQQVTWFAGLFEGEGTFAFVRERPQHISINSTDLDVLETIKKYFGGQIFQCKKKKSHHKDIWRWRMASTESVELSKLIIPYLGNRRKIRGLQYIENYSSRADLHKRLREQTSDLKRRAKELVDSGMTHQEAAICLNRSRSHITRILNTEKYKNY